MAAIYEALKALGFRETYWQLVYPGQVGGLIKNPRYGLMEFHVRFFEGGMIYAEIELGRSVIIHFLNHRSYLNRYIVGILRSRLDAPYLAYLRDATERYKSCHQKNWEEWGAQNRFMTQGAKRLIRTFAILSDWRALAFVMFASIIVSIAHGPIALATLVVVMIIVYVLAPKRSQ